MAKIYDAATLVHGHQPDNTCAGVACMQNMGGRHRRALGRQCAASGHMTSPLLFLDS